MPFGSGGKVFRSTNTRSILPLRALPPVNDSKIKGAIVSDSLTHSIKTKTESNPGGGFSERVFFRLLSSLKYGCLTVEYRQRRQVFGSPTADLQTTLLIHSNRFFHRVLVGGTIGAAESYMDKEWDSDNLTNLVRLLVRNRTLMERLDGGWSNWLRPLRALGHFFRRNTLSGAKKNIMAHYDLGNAFFELFLDDTRQYSSAFFANPEMTLQEASQAKLALIVAKLDVQPSDHVLEIGSGWGALAVTLAKTTGCRVTTTTISEEQFAFVQELLSREGLSDRVTLLKKDYRALTGQFDKLVSVEMIEAVGHQYLDTYLATCSSLLKPTGRMVLQAITIRDHHYDRAVKDVDFIKQHIFPGSFIPSLSAIMDSVKRNTDLQLKHLQDLTPHYARTLFFWKRAFQANADRLLSLGFDHAFQRLWHFYFSYCEGGFMEDAIGNAQLVFAKPQCNGTVQTQWGGAPWA
jgi:cyclopropane-fatty-acyl-phospholipid synthase